MSDKISDISLVGHELQAPLTALRTRIETALEAPWCRDACRGVLESCLVEVGALSRLIQDLLLIERADTLTRTETRFDLAVLARTVSQSFQAVAEDRGVQFSIHVREGLSVVGDESQIRRILVNLLDNAFKYTPAGGQIVLECTSSRNEVSVSIIDTGCGIPPDSIPRLFERFYQVDKVRDREWGGMGLGLSIVAALVEQNRATIEVESRAGKGSRFTVRFPRKKEHR
jgi:signal transduction histidine kinase